MMKIIKTLLLVLVFLLFGGGLWFYLEHSLPSGETVRREFLKQNPNVEIKIESAELMFDHAPKDVLTYLVKFKETNSDEKKLDEFSVKQHWNFQWYWCDNQTERKCDSESD